MTTRENYIKAATFGYPDHIPVQFSINPACWANYDPGFLSEVMALGDKSGGLMLIYGLYPGLPENNVKAVMDAMERYAFAFS